MSFNLFNRADQDALKSSNGSVRNVALKVTGYDLDSKPAKALGIRLDTNEEVAISLDDDRVAKARRNTAFDAPSIQTFASATGGMAKRRVLVGGIILFSAVFEKDGELSASWATALKHNTKSFTDPNGGFSLGDEEASSYFYTQATFNSYLDRNGQPKGGVNLLLANDKYGETLAPRLKERLTIGGKLAAPRQYQGEKALEQTRKYTEALFERGLGVVIRVSQVGGEAGVYNVLEVSPMRNYGENASEPSEWYEKRVAPILGKPEVVEYAKSGGLAFEVIPVLSATLSKNYKLSEAVDPKLSKTINRLNDRYNFVSPNGTQRLYTLSHLVLFQHPDSDALVVSSMTSELMQHTYIGADGAGYFLETEFGAGTDNGLVSTGADLKSYKIAYQPKTKTEQTEKAVNQAVENEERQVPPESAVAPEASFDDDDIPF